MNYPRTNGHVLEQKDERSLAFNFLGLRGESPLP